jgi:hypothetical protein
MERGRGPPRLTYGFQALCPVASYHKSFCLGHVLVQAMPVPKRASIVECLFEAVKDAARHFVVASPSLTASNMRASI